MIKIEIDWFYFRNILKACKKACDKCNFRRVLRYIELRADGTECVATSLDGYIMQQIKVPCDGKGIVLIPYTIQSPKCKKVVIEDNDTGNIQFSYFDMRDKLIYAQEFPRCADDYYNWSKIVETDAAEHTIYCYASKLRKALSATKYNNDAIVSINIPDDPLKPIRLATKDAQMIILPVQMRSEDGIEIRKFKNWYKCIGGENE